MALKLKIAHTSDLNDKTWYQNAKFDQCQAGIQTRSFGQLNNLQIIRSRGTKFVFITQYAFLSTQISNDDHITT